MSTQATFEMVSPNTLQMFYGHTNTQPFGSMQVTTTTTSDYPAGTIITFTEDPDDPAVKTVARVFPPNGLMESRAAHAPSTQQSAE